MPFSDEQYLKSIENNENVKRAFIKIKEACQELQNETGCPDEDVDDFLQFLVEKWK
tara:strand:+ start:2204 stop:2371 length:168 start_codon:yes stop_codon:yes gene_type:complete